MFNSEIDLATPFLIFARLCGFFLFSPFFGNKKLTLPIRLGVAIACSLSVVPPLLNQTQANAPSHFVFDFLKEIAIGYLLGWIVALLLEAAAFAGQLISVTMGFSATELLDPSSSSEHPLLSRFYVLFTFTLFFILDLHHPLLRLIFESYQTVPLNLPFTPKTVLGFIQMSNHLFHHALEYALFPLTLLLPLIAVFALLSRFLAIFWIGFPLQLLVGFTAIAIGIKLFVPILEYNFFQSLEFIKKFIVNY